MNLHQSEGTDTTLSDKCIDFVTSVQPDFTFLYLGETDEKGHDKGWMSEEYLKTVYNAIDCIQRVYENLPEGYTLIVTADHGGHERSHGTTMPEDMVIPILFCGPKFKGNEKLENVSIKDIAVTVAKLLEVPPVREWEGAARC
jgi:phosphopentomutase